MKNHVIIDLESLGPVPNSALLSGAWVIFQPHSGVIVRERSSLVDVRTSIDIGMSVSDSTIRWWLSQSESARQSQYQTSEKVLTVQDFVKEMAQDLASYCVDRVWSLGADWDNATMRILFDKFQIDDKIGRNSRCLRTIRAFFPEEYSRGYQLGKEFHSGELHDPLFDCKAQMEGLLAVFNANPHLLKADA